MPQKQLSSKNSGNFFNQLTGFVNDKVYAVLLLGLLSLIVFSIFKYYNGYENSIDWILTSNTSPSPISFDEFNVGLFRFEIPADNYLIWQTFSPTEIQIDYHYFYGFLIALIIGFSAFQTTYSRMNIYPFIFCNLGFILLYNLIHLEELLIFGITGRYLIFVFIGLHLLLGFLFQSSFKAVNAGIRFLSFLLLHSIKVFIIWQFAEVGNPFLVIAPYAFFSGAILSILFIALVAQEVIFGILQLTTSSSFSGATNGKHFLILGSLYLINLLLLYIRNSGVIGTEVAVIDEFWVLIISTLIALWTFKNKQVLLESYPFSSFGKYLIVGLGILCFALLSFQFENTNNPVIEAFKDLISFIHLGFGIMFFLYVILNFLDPLLQNIQVYKIVYKEVNFPYVSSLLAGLAIVAGFFFYSGKSPYLEIRAGYFNLHGDVQQEIGNYSLAESYYKGGKLFGGNNHKSNYHLAFLSAYEGKDYQVEDYLQKSLFQDPSEYAFISLSEFYKNKGDFFKNIFTLQNGLKVFPKSEFLRNNLAMQYAKTNILDSALYYFDTEFYAKKWEEVSEINNWFIYAKSNLVFNPDSVNNLIDLSTSPLTNNLIAYANLKDQRMNLTTVNIPQDSALNSNTFSLLNNLTLNYGKNNVKALSSSLKAAAAYYGNGDFKNLIDYNIALQNYKLHDYNSFFRGMDAAQSGSERAEKGNYYNTIGLVAMKLNAPRLALDYFGSALQYNFKEAKINYGVALNEAHLKEKAIEYWSSLINNPMDSIHHIIAYNQLKILTLTKEELLNINNDAVLYQYLRAHISLISFENFLETMQLISNQNMKADLLIGYAEDQINAGKSNYLNEITPLLDKITIESEQLVKSKRDLKISLAVINNDVERLNTFSNELDSESKNIWPVLRIFEAGADTAALRLIHYELGFKDPFNIPFVMMATAYFEEVNDKNTNYEILLNAIEVNPYAIPLLKAYILTSIKQNLFNYADEVLPRVQALTNTAEFELFKEEVKTLKETISNTDLWENVISDKE